MKFEFTIYEETNNNVKIIAYLKKKNVSLAKQCQELSDKGLSFLEVLEQIKTQGDIIEYFDNIDFVKKVMGGRYPELAIEYDNWN